MSIGPKSQQLKSYSAAQISFHDMHLRIPFPEQAEKKRLIGFFK